MRRLLVLGVVGGCGGGIHEVAMHGPTTELAIADAVPTANGGVLARTDDGAVIWLDAQLHVVAQDRPASGVTAIATNGGEAFIAHDDGTIEASPAHRIVAKLDGTPLWFEVTGTQVLAFTLGAERDLALRIDVGTDHERVIAIPRDTWGSAMFKSAPSHFVHVGNLVWFGMDSGEWGGVVGRVDTTSGTVAVFHDYHQPVHGFAAAGTRVIAFGGLRHRFSNDGYVGELRDGKPGKPVFVQQTVDAMIATADGFLAVIWDHLERVDPTLESWTPIARTPLSDEDPTWIRSVQVRTMFQLGSRLVLATRRGFFELRGTRFVPAGT